MHALVDEVETCPTCGSDVSPKAKASDEWLRVLERWREEDRTEYALIQAALAWRKEYPQTGSSTNLKNAVDAFIAGHGA